MSFWLAPERSLPTRSRRLSALRSSLIVFPPRLWSARRPSADTIPRYVKLCKYFLEMRIPRATVAPGVRRLPYQIHSLVRAVVGFADVTVVRPCRPVDHCLVLLFRFLLEFSGHSELLVRFLPSCPLCGEVTTGGALGLADRELVGAIGTCCVHNNLERELSLVDLPVSHPRFLITDAHLRFVSTDDSPVCEYTPSY